jgi:peptidoglycan hydrolase CwlO-like protein
MLSLIPKDKVDSISNEVSKAVMKNVGSQLTAEFQKVEEEFKKYANYINSVENKMDERITYLEKRVIEFEKGKDQKGELQGTD